MTKCNTSPITHSVAMTCAYRDFLDEDLAPIMLIHGFRPIRPMFDQQGHQSALFK